MQGQWRGRQASGTTLTGTLGCGRIPGPLPVGTGSHGCRVGGCTGTAHRGSAGGTPLWALVTVRNRPHGHGAGPTLGRVLERPGHSRAWGLGSPGEQKEGARANLGTGGVGRQCRWAGRGDGPTSATSVVPGRGSGPCGHTGWVGVGWRPGAGLGREGPERPVPWSVAVRGVGPGFSLALEPEVWTFQLLSCGK